MANSNAKIGGCVCAGVAPFRIPCLRPAKLPVTLRRQDGKSTNAKVPIEPFSPGIGMGAFSPKRSLRARSLRARHFPLGAVKPFPTAHRKSWQYVIGESAGIRAGFRNWSLSDSLSATRTKRISPVLCFGGSLESGFRKQREFGCLFSISCRSNAEACTGNCQVRKADVSRHGGVLESTSRPLRSDG